MGSLAEQLIKGVSRMVIFRSRSLESVDVYKRQNLEYAIQQLKLPGAPEALSFDTEMEQRFSRRVALRDVFVRTLGGQAAGVAYQPIYARDADTPCMAEALLRLCGADGKPVPTADVVSVAEEMDLIDRKSTRLNSSHSAKSRMPSSA